MITTLILTLFFTTGEPPRTFEFQSMDYATCETNKDYIAKIIMREAGNVYEVTPECRKV
ncbi:hypothetical protein PHIM7_314 [Sinorhizobium phage phiM7]|uniref:Uncharacterized protein n=3 Tax=Emdodecavirus TaxID=1980937 RepID=S5M7I8_9CAUD|nr:hypothetical protein AB690_gp199 [Sinorhizobium phage phiM12]YP_009212559.1 hypothetical protein AVT40_gp214 [Sinorhizobium phage phiN3]YP_009601439.1 hypothetical protein FDH46_gp164 [Sinorhizobium phage phiM7]AKF13219.1 hypothetical protein PHIM19_314 [Sinorhizobium phage phiM19]AGR48036.1 hypothetical protein SmphiM12_404 [Sinorhizobium phage phiM12]AKF12860.1 hypothetical protein PHIM7_314 [Sinorhizobium phage phiM7]AKF13582.1 hypothetical protein PHIN3_319 [Sinorhizobium phage phiN3]